jgi:hypothetical protein
MSEFLQDIALQIPELAVSLVLFSNVLCNGDVYDGTSSCSWREE